MRPIEPMRINDDWRPEPAARVRSQDPDDTPHRRRPPSRRRLQAQQRLQAQRRPRPRRGPTPTRTRHLRAGTARRALAKNLAHLQRCLADGRLPDAERRVLHQSMAALEGSLQDHRALRTNMATMILG